MKTNVIGIDLGATNIRSAVVVENVLSNIVSARIHSHGSVEEVLNDVYNVVDELMNDSVKAIGIGVPSVVDVAEGIVYDVQYIPSWKEVPLKKWMEEKYKVPVFVNNDANCFAVGEHYFGKSKDVRSMVGVTLGTGLGAGIIINGKLYSGFNCGAGEFGLIDYKDKVLEYYSSGSFFQNVYELDGEKVFEEAKRGDTQALQLYAELGTHIGNAIKIAMYAYDPQLIVLGGSVRMAYQFFQKQMWEEIKTFVYSKSIQRIKIEVSTLKNSGILGAAALYYDATAE